VDPTATELRPGPPSSTEDDAGVRARPRHRRLLQELAIRGSVSLLVLIFNEVLGIGAVSPVIRFTGLLGLLSNGPYYLAARTGLWPRGQAFGRMLADIVFLTVGLYSAGGLAAARYLGVYAIVPVYAGIVFSGGACLVATGAATASYLAVVLLQQAGWLPPTPSPLPDGWSVAAFNLLILNIVGGLTALLAEAYRRSRRQLAGLYQDLERANDQLLRLNTEIQRVGRLQVLGEVVASVTHEIRNTVQLAVTHIELACSKVDDLPTQVVRHLETAKQSCETIVRIVKGSLEMARQPSAQKLPVSLADVARSIVDLKTPDLRKDRIFIRIDFPPAFPSVLAVPFQLQQVLLNLVINAQDALRGVTGPRTIEIVGLSRYRHVVIEVRDTGPGIPSDVLPRLFEPFYTTKPSGTGLGLAVSAGIIRELGGELTAVNRPDRGAVFRLSLPAIRSVLAEAR